MDPFPFHVVFEIPVPSCTIRATYTGKARDADEAALLRVLILVRAADYCARYSRLYNNRTLATLAVSIIHGKHEEELRIPRDLPRITSLLSRTWDRTSLHLGDDRLNSFWTKTKHTQLLAMCDVELRRLRRFLATMATV